MNPGQTRVRKKNILGQGKNFYTEAERRQARENADEAQRRGIAQTEYYRRQMREAFSSQQPAKAEQTSSNDARNQPQRKKVYNPTPKQFSPKRQSEYTNFSVRDTEAEKKEAANKAGNLARERGIAQTNRINQKKEYDAIQKKNAAKSAADSAQDRGQKLTSTIKAQQEADAEKNDVRNKRTRKRVYTPTPKQFSPKKQSENTNFTVKDTDDSKQRIADAMRAGDAAQERGKARTNRVNQQREYEAIQRRNTAKKAADSANERGRKLTNQIKYEQESKAAEAKARAEWNIWNEQSRGKKLTDKLDKERKAASAKTAAEKAQARGKNQTASTKTKQANDAKSRLAIENAEEAQRRGISRTEYTLRQQRERDTANLAKARANKANGTPVLPKDRKASATDRTAKEPTKATAAKRTAITPNEKKASATDRKAKETLKKAILSKEQAYEAADEAQRRGIAQTERYYRQQKAQGDAELAKARANKNSTPVTPNQKVASATERTAKPVKTKPAESKRTAVTPNQKKSDATERKAKEQIKKAMLSKEEARELVDEEQRKGIARTERTYRQQREQGGTESSTRANKKSTPVTPNQKAATEAGRTTKETPAAKKSSGTAAIPNKKIASATDRTAKETPSTGATKSQDQVSKKTKNLSSNISVSKLKSKSNKSKSGKPSEKSFTKSKKNVSIEKTKKTLKKAFNANKVMRQRRAKAMQGRTAFNATTAMRQRREAAMKNRNPKNNPKNINLRGITKKGKKR